MNGINTLAPVFLVIALGAALRRGGFLSDAAIRTMNRLAYWIGLPVLLFHKIAEAPSIAGAGHTFTIVLIGTIGAIVVGFAAARLMGVKPAGVATFVQGAFRGNLAYVGLAVIFYAFSGAGEVSGGDAEAMGVLAVGPIVPIYNIVAVIILLAGRHDLGGRKLAHTALGIITNPLLLACAAGLVFSLLGGKLPTFAANTLEVVGQLALPVALMAIGGTLVAAKFSGRVLPAIVASVIKVAVTPAIGLGVATLLGAGPAETRVALILLACPTAIASFVLADQLGGDSSLAAGIVVVSTLMSLASLSVVIATI